MEGYKVAQAQAKITVELPANSRPVKYAEEIGVFRLFQELQGFQEQYGAELEGRNQAEQSIREQRELIEERKAALLETVNTDGTLTSQAAIERAFREACNKDDLLGEREQTLREYQDQHGDAEVAVKCTEVKIRSHLRQMDILAAYLEYLAAERQGRTVNRALGADL
jgi:hypothetical protein